MKIKLLFVFGLLLASAWAENEENVIAGKAKADVDLGNLKSDDENVDKKVVENVEETENGVSASAKNNNNFFK